METFLSKHERVIILILCILGACRIFLFSAAFPLYNNVDEPEHFDLVYKYSRGFLPQKGGHKYSPEVAEFIEMYDTYEYLSNPNQYPDGKVPTPLWKFPNIRRSELFIAITSDWLEKYNHEAESFPVYYFTAGLWYRLGEFLGITGGNLPYWVRFLNVPLVACLVWIAYLLARAFFDTPVQRIGLPLLVAFIPQDVFYSINNDVMSPLFFAISFFMLLQLHFKDKSRFYYLLTGLCIAATLLVKVSNLAILIPLVIIVLLKTKKLFHNKKLSKYLPHLIMLTAGVILPVGAWLARNRFVLGDLGGSATKIQLLGWTLKPLSKMGDHPIFSLRGLSHFFMELLKTFWRGEIVWHWKNGIPGSGYTIHRLHGFVYALFRDSLVPA